MSRTSAPILPARPRTGITPPAQVLPATSSVDVACDIDTALALADHAPHGTAAAQLRERLRQHITNLAVPAQEFADWMPDGRGRDIALATVHHARNMAATQGGDPVASLRLLAKLAQHLARYAADNHSPARRRAA
ncbi:hypothetical protein [Streptomyces sp. NBC_00239]|uniref:hypothetical protein n=1 Tax=Streptomyces sp. NBC_00239 TaxID=2903640 RepID=UPI002E2D8E49|nr:hypothetical protein [Streptomyces sp. NBC_00239]